MKDLISSVQQAIIERNFITTSHLFEKARKTSVIANVADSIETDYRSSLEHTLELRDHVAYYLGIWDVYFAVQMTSFQMLRLLNEVASNDVHQFMLDFVRSLNENQDSRFNQFYISIETISKGQYAVLLPHILKQRLDELESCKVLFRHGSDSLYCISNLWRTYYGQKILLATLKDHEFETVVNERTFEKISQNLKSAGLDISNMLDEIDSDQWEEVVCRVAPVDLPLQEHKELGTLHRVYAARTEIFLDSFRKQAAALETILSSKSRLCNDVLMLVASDNRHEMRLRALKGLGDTGGSNILEFLSNMLNDRNLAVRNVAARALSTLASHERLSGRELSVLPTSLQAPSIDISKINRILNALIAKEMPIAMIEDTLIALTAQNSKSASSILTRLLAKPQINIKKAIIRSSRRLKREDAAPIIRAALVDESTEIVALAEHELNSRWPDEVWDEL